MSKEVNAFTRFWERNVCGWNPCETIPSADVRNRAALTGAIALAGMVALAVVIVLLMSGCVIVYAPKAERVAGQMHDQQAEYMPIDQAFDPQLANELVGAQAVGIKGDVGSKNTIASPSAKLK